MTQEAAEQQILEHRYCYYILNKPEITDKEYDKLEKAYIEMFPNSKILNSVGSDRAEDYPAAITQRQ